MTREQTLETLLAKIATRATRTLPGSAEAVPIKGVPAALLDQAIELLGGEEAAIAKAAR